MQRNATTFSAKDNGLILRTWNLPYVVALVSHVILIKNKSILCVETLMKKLTNVLSILTDV